MVLPTVADALFIIVLLIPGFIAFYITKRLGSFVSPMSEFETTVWSLVFSTIILFFFVTITQLSDLDKRRQYFFVPINFGILFLLTAGVGVIGGWIFHRFRKSRTIEDSWNYALMLHGKYTNKHSGPEQKDNKKLIVTVYTKDDKSFVGHLYHASELTTLYLR
jgi:Family of unknown function (DUF6338)